MAAPLKCEGCGGESIKHLDHIKFCEKCQTPNPIHIGNHHYKCQRRGCFHVTKDLTNIHEYQCNHCGQGMEDHEQEIPTSNYEYGEVPNCIYSTHHGIPYIAEMHIHVADPQHPDFYKVALKKPPRKAEIALWGLPKAQQFWDNCKPVLPWYWMPDYTDAVAEARWPTGDADKFNYRWWDHNTWEKPYDAKDPKWAGKKYNPEDYVGVPDDEMARIAIRDGLSPPIQLMQDFAKREWDRRLNGFWFMNKGVATYLTGSNYFYLAWFTLEDQIYAEFRYLQWKIWNFWEYEVLADPTCIGLIHPKFRREGATGMALSDLLETTTRNENWKSGIVSKNDNDCKETFDRLVLANTNLPAFFRGIQKGKDVPAKKLEFNRPPKRAGKKSAEVGMNSFVDTRPTTISPFDSTKRKRVLFDEPGKIPKVNVLTMYSAMKEVTKQGMIRVGCMWLMSTVDSLEGGGGDNFLILNENSRQIHKNMMECSETGLKRIFIDCVEGIEGWIDQYGMGVQDSPTPEQKVYLSAKYPKYKPVINAGIGAIEYVKTQHKKGASERRKFPRKYTDCFIADSAGCMFNEAEILAQIDVNDTMKQANLYRIGDFEWKDGKKYTEVVWKDFPEKLQDGKGHPRAKYKIWFPKWLLDKPNNVARSQNSGTRMFRPLNYHISVIGLDPQKTEGKKNRDRSNSGMYAFWKHDEILDPLKRPFEQWESHSFFAEYVNRPQKLHELYDDVIKLAWYCGTKILIETNVSDWALILGEMGLLDFMAVEPNAIRPSDMAQDFIKEKENPKYGVTNASNGGSYSVNETHARNWDLYLELHVKRIRFNRLLESLLTFDKNDTEESDAAMGGAYCLMDVMSRKEYKPPKTNVSRDWFPKYKMDGTYA